MASTGATCVQLPDQPDTIAPAIVLQTPTQNSVVNSTVQITADVQDNRSVAQVQFFADGVLKSTLQAGPWRFFWDSTQVGDGPRLLRLVATDVNDNTSTLDINVVVQNGNTPLAPVISTSSVAPQSLVYAGSPVTVNYTATATDPDGGNVTYRWSFGDGTADASTASGAHSYSAVGPNYHLALTVTDNENQTTSKEWNVVVSDLPILGNIIHFNLLDQDGNTVKTADLAGKVVGVNFWATWCLPCRQEFPDLEEAYTLFGAQGYVMVGVDSFDLSQPSELKAWRLTNTLLTYPLVLDVGMDFGDTLGAYSAVFGDHTNTLPQTAVADRNGKVRFYKIGRLASGELPAVLAKLVPFAP
ncbi:MAG: redoxin domain-containing protein [bacterium]